MNTQDDIRLVEENISVRLNPFIYAFSTNTIPRYLKVGDTLRGVDVRIAEWQKAISQKLHSESVKLTEEFRWKAMLTDEIYFRDYSVHEYLKAIGKHRIADPEIRKLYSQEFFADTSVSDVQSAIQSITDDFNSEELSKIYSYYSIKENKSATVHGANDKKWTLRPNQKAVVDAFIGKPDKSELLMYAVMRFGKSFTAMSCALAVNAQKVLIVSAKADVAGEWQKTVETPECFKEYTFLTDVDLSNGTLISDILAQPQKNRVALFLTLQNLTGKARDGKNIKNRLEQVFGTEFDLIIVDETHYGAWANSYGEPLKDADEDIIKEERREYINFGKQVARVQGKQKLHLSGTPYNLLYDNKFTADNIIATCQFKDILQDKEKWDIDHFDDIENGVENPDTDKPYQEFDNPYFGFPKMLRFAFNLPKNTRAKLEKSKYNWTLNDLFETTVNNDIASFVHEQDVLDLLKAIDGAKPTDGILGFLDIPKIKDNNVCKHMVFVLPRKYACDAMENLLLAHKDEFNNLGKYEVLNITGHALKPELDSVDKVKSKIAELEKGDKKSITLTVYKMLTGVTVKEWDTMFMLKNTRSAQEYDQAAFRIQNQYVEECITSNAKNNEPPIMKIDKKPQTILVDFDPIRMFTLQGLSSRIVEHVKTDNATLSENIEQELNYFPIIAYNADKLVKVEPNDLIELITQYNSNKSIMDSVQSVMLDKGLLDNDFLLQYIENQSPTSAKNKLDTPAHVGKKESDIREPEDDGNGEQQSGQSETDSDSQSDDKNADDKDIEKKYRMCIARLSFYAFLTKSNIDDLQDIIDSLQKGCEHYKDNKRIFSNLQLNYDFIVELKNHLSHYFALNVDDALKRANLLSNDGNLLPEERALNAIKNFNRFSDSEIVTPNNICADMVSHIGKETLVSILEKGDKILDIASKTGEFAFALFDLLKDSVDIGILRNGIYSIPTSGTAYEFTRRIYEVLELNIDNIADPQNFTSYDLLTVTKPVKKKESIDYDKIKLLLTQNKDFSTITLNDPIIEGATKMTNFGAIVGNPPYQENIGSTANKSLSRQLFPTFIKLSIQLGAHYVSLLTPSRWFTGNAQDRSFVNLREFLMKNNHIKTITSYLNSKEVFGDIDLSGGVNYFVFERGYCGNICFNEIIQGQSMQTIRPLFEDGLDVILPLNKMISILQKVRARNFVSIETIVSGRNPFGVPADEESLKAVVSKEKDKMHQVLIYCAYEELYFISQNEISRAKAHVDKWKVFTSKMNGGAGTLLDGKPVCILGKTYLGAPNSICSNTLLSIGAFERKYEAMNLQKYMYSKFFRFMLGVKKIAQVITSNVYSFVPLQDFTDKSDIDWSKTIPEIDAQLYAKYNLDESEIAFIEKMIKSME